MATITLTNGTQQIRATTQQAQHIYTTDKGWKPVGAPTADTTDPAGMTKTELQNHLDTLGIAYPASAKKPELLGLATHPNPTTEQDN